MELFTDTVGRTAIPRFISRLPKLCPPGNNGFAGLTGNTKNLREENLKLRSVALAAGAAVALSALTGCATKSPPYSPSIANVSKLKAAGTAPVAIGAFSVKSDLPGAAAIGMRGSSMSSSIGSDYAAYLAEAIRLELELAGRLDPKSTLEISGTLLRNDLDASGISKGTAAVEGRFVVKRDGQVRFDKVKRGTAEWESSFAGAVALPRAAQNYPIVVQELLTALYADADFQSALR